MAPVGMREAIYIGYDSREVPAFAVAKHSIRRRLILPIPVRGIVLDDVRQQGLYWRPTEVSYNDHGAPLLFDVISAHPMSTEFAISRFLTPHLAGSGWALFMDCDMLCRGQIEEVFRMADPRYAVMCVKHQYDPPEGVKMDGQVQSRYQRKNWTSFMLFNCDHPANKRLTLELINEAPGRDLHRFCWLEDHEIGELPVEWNWLVGHNDLSVDPKNVHFTSGTPLMKGYENVPFADEFMAALTDWAAGRG